MRTMLLTAGLLAGLATPAFAHENGVIRLASKSLALGAELAMRGEKLPKNATLRLELRGALSTFALGTVSTDSAGTFQLGRSLPPDVRAGSYVVVAIAPDGDKVAQADLSITPAPAPDAMAAMPGMAGHATATTAGGDAGPRPTAEAMRVPVKTSDAEHVAMSAIIGLALAAGAGLLAQARRSESQRS
ncbi:MAG TPA: hypothetical protein VJL28_09025 [Gemmatimonadaceae bacterium]|nr:hypothetical protein [Gemmatimonadaceae bacterium]